MTTVKRWIYSQISHGFAQSFNSGAQPLHIRKSDKKSLEAIPVSGQTCIKSNLSTMIGYYGFV